MELRTALGSAPILTYAAAVIDIIEDPPDGLVCYLTIVARLSIEARLVIVLSAPGSAMH